LVGCTWRLQAASEGIIDWPLCPMKVTVASLARELRVDSRRIIADARCEGIYVALPTDRVPISIARQIRAKRRRPKLFLALAEPDGVRHHGPHHSPMDEFPNRDGLTSEEIKFLLSIV